MIRAIQLWLKTLHFFCRMRKCKVMHFGRQNSPLASFYHDVNATLTIFSRKCSRLQVFQTECLKVLLLLCSAFSIVTVKAITPSGWYIFGHLVIPSGVHPFVLTWLRSVKLNAACHVGEEKKKRHNELWNNILVRLILWKLSDIIIETMIVMILENHNVLIWTK